MNLDPYDLNAFIAPKYDGLSHKTTSPSFKNTLPAKSILVESHWLLVYHL